RRRKAVELEIRVSRVQRAQKFFVPLDTELWVQSALHQHARSAERDCLVNLLANLFKGLDVRVRLSGPSVEGAEGADDVADVRVVDVAVNDVRDDAFGVFATPNLVRRHAHTRDVVRLEKDGALLRRHALAREHAVKYGLDVFRVHKTQSTNPPVF